MKKVSKLLSLFLAGSLILGGTFLGCSSGDDDDNGGTQQGGGDGGQSGGNGGGQQGGGDDAPAYAGPESVVTPDLSVAPATEGEIKINDVVFNGTFAEAVASITGSGDYVITLAPGTYVSNNIMVENPNVNLKIKGLGTAKYGADVILAGKGTNGTGSSEGNRCTFEFNYNNKGKGSLILENLTIKNTYARNNDTSNTQNEALGFDGAYCAAYNCGFFAYQDTVRTIGKAWFYGCYIEGDVDFMWMEKSGKVALYENCAIKTVWDETNTAKTPTAHILAPGMNAADNFNKGLVVWNSAVDASVATNLFRNPWGTSETLYNIAAFVNIKFFNENNVNDKVQETKSASNYDLNDAIGYKLDKDLADLFPNRSTEIHVIPVALEKAEYNGRNRIINRIYKLNPGKYANDADVWDVNKLASDNGWNVVADTSKLDEANDNLKANGVYKIAEYATDTTQYAPIADGSSTDGFVSWTGIQYHTPDYGTVVNGSSATGTVTVEVAGDSIVSFIGSTYANGTMRVTDEAGNVVLDTYSTKPAADKPAIAIAYAGPATKLTFTFTGTTYIGDITVTPSDGEKQAVKKVVVSGDDAVTKDDTITLKATVTAQYCAPVTVTWTSSDESIATVDANGVVTGKAEGEATITATSTFDTSKKASIKVVVSAMPSSKAVFFASKTAGWNAEVSDTSLIAVTTATKSAAGKNKDNTDCAVTSWDWNDGKNGIQLVAVDDDPTKGEWYIEYPITAVKDVMLKKANIKWGATGTGNFRPYVTFRINEGENELILDGTDIKARDQDNESSTFVFDKEIKAGETGYIRISLYGNSQALASNKTPIWGKTEITCQLNEPEPPVAGTTYTWDFLGENTAKYQANADGTAHTDGFLTYKQRAWKGDGHAFNTGTNDTLAVTVIGSVTIKVSQTYDGAGWTVTTTGGTLSSADLAAQTGTADYSVTLTAAADAVNTVTFDSKGQNYASKVVVAPAN